MGGTFIGNGNSSILQHRLCIYEIQDSVLKHPVRILGNSLGFFWRRQYCTGLEGPNI